MEDVWFAWSPILSSTSALDFKLTAILVQSCHMFLLDSTHDSLVPTQTNDDTL